MAVSKKKKKPAPQFSEGIKLSDFFVRSPIVALCKVLEISPDILINRYLEDLAGDITDRQRWAVYHAGQHLMNSQNRACPFNETNIQAMLQEISAITGMHIPFREMSSQQRTEYFKRRDAFLLKWIEKWTHLKTR
ncbi:MAG TPA: hypothetical protein VGN00_07605 [Puia sp.]|jgi:hypothetical protein